MYARRVESSIVATERTAWVDAVSAAYAGGPSVRHRAVAVVQMIIVAPQLISVVTYAAALAALAPTAW